MAGGDVSECVDSGGAQKWRDELQGGVDRCSVARTTIAREEISIKGERGRKRR